MTDWSRIVIGQMSLNTETENGLLGIENQNIDP